MIIVNKGDARLADYAAAVAPIFPDVAHQRPGRALLDALAFGPELLTDDAFAAAGAAPEAGEAGYSEPVSEAELRAALNRMPNVERNAHGELVGFAGLSRTSTAHSLTLSDPRTGAPVGRWGWCAWDVIFLPTLLGVRGTAQTTCPISGDTLTFDVEDGRLAVPEGSSWLLLLPLAGDFDPAQARTTFCCCARIVRDAQAAEQWIEKLPQCVAYTLEAGVELGILATAAFGPAPLRVPEAAR